MKQLWLCAWTLTLAANLCGGSAAAEEPQNWINSPSAADQHVVGLLDTAIEALDDLDHLDPGIDRDSAYNAALASLTQLYEVYGCTWALPALKSLHADPRRTGMLCGWTQDGKVNLRVEPLALRDSVFAGSMILLVTLLSETSMDTEGGEDIDLQITLESAETIQPDVLTPSHILYSRLEGLRDTFQAPSNLPSGAGKAFKQIFTVSDPPAALASVRLTWGGSTILARRYQ